MNKPARRSLTISSCNRAVLALLFAAGVPVLFAAPLRSPWDGKHVAITGAAYSCPAIAHIAPDLVTDGFYRLDDPTHSIIDPVRQEAYRKSSDGVKNVGLAIVAAADDYRNAGSRSAAQCAMTQILTLAQEHALAGKMSSNQAYYVQGWVVGAIAIAYLKIREAGLATPQQTEEITKWMQSVGEQTKQYYDEHKKAGQGDSRNNHLYWAGVELAAIGVAANDRKDFDWAMAAYDNGVDQIRPDGSLPLEMARGGRALHYHLYGKSGVEVASQLFGGYSGGQAGQFSLSVDANMASGPTSLPLEFVDGALSQAVPMAVQVSSFSDFKVNVEPSTVALEAGATQPFKVSGSALGAFSGPIQVSLDNLPAGVQASPQSFPLAPGSSETVTLTAGSSYSAGGTLSVDSTSGSINHATQVAVSPGSAATALVVTGNTFSGLGVAQMFNSGTYNTFVSIDPYPNSTYPNAMQALLAYVPYSQLGSFTSNCNGNINNSACTPVNIAIYPYAPLESPVLDQPGTITLNANVPGVPSAVVQFDQILPDFTLSFSPSALTIPAGGGAALAVTSSAISPTFTSYCGTSFVANLSGSKLFNATLTAPPNGLVVSPAPLDLCASNPATTSVSVPADTPPGNYEISVNAQVSTGCQPYYSARAQYNPIATIAAAHTFGVGVTVTAAAPPAPAPGFQLAFSPADISIAAGQSFPVTLSATASNGFTGTISVSAGSLPSGVTISPSSFTLNAGSSQPVTVSVAPGTAAASDQITLTGTSGSTTGSTQISVTVP